VATSAHVDTNSTAAAAARAVVELVLDQASAVRRPNAGAKAR
jgi:hypothetical protein